MNRRRARARTAALVLASIALAVTILTASAGAGVVDYTGTLYFSGTTSTKQTGTGTYQISTGAPGGSGLMALNRIAQGYPFGTPTACSGIFCGYQEFAPGAALATGPQCPNLNLLPTCTTPALVSPPSPNGKGWIVDGNGGMNFPTGDWTFQVKTKLNASAGTAHLVVGMWKVTTGPFAAVQTLIDPTSAGENGTNLVTAAGTLTITHTVTGLAGFSLGWNEHLYVQFWRRQTTTMTNGNVNRQATLFADDGTAAITAHPTPDGWPTATLNTSADGLRTNVIPQLGSTYSDPEATSGSVSFQLCSDAACSTVLAPASVPSVANGATALWTPGGPLSDGTYYWRANATDGATHQSGWTTTRSFVLDRVPPGVPALGSPANLLRTKSSILSATFSDPDAGDSGSVAFRVCSPSCPTVVATGSSTSVANNASGTWTISPALPDGLYYWEAQATDAAGNPSAWSSARSFTLDTTPPDTTLGSPTPVNPTKITSASFSFTATEAGSTFECSFDGASFAACTSPQAFAGLADASHTFQVRATDIAGNTDPTPASHTWTVDTIAPDTTIGPGKPASLSNVAAPSFDLASTEASSTFECKLDAGAFAACPNPKVYSGLSDGSHTVQVRATDQAGNTDATPATYTWTVDTTPPETTLGTPLPVDPTKVTSADFTFTTELGATLACSFDGSTYAPCTSPTSYVALADGTHTFLVRATDAAGNVDPTPASATWRVDTTPPVTAIDGHPGSRNNLRQPSFDFSANEAVTGFECSVDAGTFGSCRSPYRTPSLTDGTHTFRVRATADFAGNAGADVSYTWIVDTLPPSTPVLDGPADGTLMTTSPAFSAKFVNPDAADLGTILFRVCTRAASAGNMCSDRVADGTSFTTGHDGTMLTWASDSPFADGTYYWQASAQDDAGNRSGWSATRSFTLDNSAPALASSAPVDGARANKAPKLTATFTDPTHGDRGTVEFQLCSDEACAALLASGSSAVTAWGAAASWAPPTLRDGTYFWRAHATDAVGNSAGWTTSQRLVIDTTAPSLPGLVTPADGATTRLTALSAGFLDPDIDDLGAVLFRICMDPGCRLVVSSGGSAPVGNGTAATWAPKSLRDGSFFWQAAARDAAGNVSGWTAARKFTLDRKLPAQPRGFSGAVVAGQLVLRWQHPLASSSAVAVYRLYIDGVMSQEMSGVTLRVALGKFDALDARTFSLVSVDKVGNVSRRTHILVGVPNLLGLTTQEASSMLVSRGLVLSAAPRQALTGKTAVIARPGQRAVVVAQRPGPRAIVAVGTAVAVVAGAARSPVSPARP